MSATSEGLSEFRRGLVPVAPVVRARSLCWRPRKASLPALTDSPQFTMTTSGRTALALGFRAVGVAPGDEVLLPAYHCLAMIGPVVASGAVPVFYRMKSDLSPDMEHLDRKRSPRTRAVVVVHYFGFLQDLETMRRWCDDFGIALVEDCAHALYGDSKGVAVGHMGDFAIGSLMKFHPLFDGGCLVSFRRDLPRFVQRGPGLAFELKALVNVLERSFGDEQSRRSRIAARVLRAVNRSARRLVSRSGTGAVAVPRAIEGGFEFEPSWVDRAPSLASRLMYRYANHDRAITRRRRLYGAYLTALGESKAGRALYPLLGEHEVPYVFPYLLDREPGAFESLWRAGIPLYRWESVADEVCPVSREYRDRLVQLPCHQELSDAQISWLLQTAKRVLGG